jgi:hypothetical protein
MDKTGISFVALDQTFVPIVPLLTKGKHYLMATLQLGESDR